MTRMMDDRETWYTLIDSLLSMMHVDKRAL